jgi:hypothetical protein
MYDLPNAYAHLRVSIEQLDPIAPDIMLRIENLNSVVLMLDSLSDWERHDLSTRLFLNSRRLMREMHTQSLQRANQVV